jgi:delta-aminolevulinic acid dehydratase/porphobilinogen synthase
MPVFYDRLEMRWTAHRVSYDKKNLSDGSGTGLKPSKESHWDEGADICTGEAGLCYLDIVCDLSNEVELL